MDFWQKIETDFNEDLLWNIPEQKQGSVNIIGGNAQVFRAPVKVAEFLANNYPLKDVRLIVPSALKNQLPPLDNIVFLSSTESGSFSDEKELSDIIKTADYNILIGDLSHNSNTARAVTGACKNAASPLLITRDSVDLLIDNSTSTEKILQNNQIAIFGTMAQLQKLLRSVYYPKMILLSQSLMQIVETLHKFTLSYQISIVTFHGGSILVAKDGKVASITLDKTKYTVLTLWSGELAGKIAALNLYNPNSSIEATICACLK